MSSTLRSPGIRTVLVVLVAAWMTLSAGPQHAAAADAGKLVLPFNGQNLHGWQLKGPVDRSQWKVGIAGMDSSQPHKLVVAAVPSGEKGALVNAQGHGVDIYTMQKFGDCTIRLELMVPQKSNSGVYLMGEYEIQVLDSYGRPTPGMGDLGAVYGAAAPKVNAALPPGQWQTMEIVFVAPRFTDGRKTANARILRITLNGKLIQENLELPNVTPGGLAGQETPEGPLMFQGDHGPVAYRNIEILVPQP